MTNSETLHENRVQVLGTNSDIINKNAAISIVKTFLNSSSGNGKFVIFTPNPEIVADARGDFEFRSAVNEADLLLIDGKGLQLAIQYLNEVSSVKSTLLRPVFGLYYGACLVCHTLVGKRLHVEQNGAQVEVSRVSGVDFVNELFKEFPEKTFYFIGTKYQSQLESADGAFKALQKQQPNLRLVGSTSCRQFNQKQGKYEDIPFEVVREKILSDMGKIGISSIDFLIVGTGHKRQELWIQKHKNDLPAKVFMGVGGTFDFIRGSKKRAPAFLRFLGLEWVFRLMQEPTIERFFRILKAFPYFPILVYIDSLKLPKKH
jgi:N-acetylglucosaminyldiphosphoundecaprenol N-acetyl-beta-D-mannosaminyltransferase